LIELFLIISACFWGAKADVVDLVLADSLIKQGDCIEAAIHYKRYLSAAYSPLAESNMAAALFCSGKKEEALGSAQKAYAANPSDPVIKYNLAMLYSDRENFSGSLKLLDSVTPQSIPDEKKDNYYSMLCWDNFKLGNVEKAAAQCRLIQEKNMEKYPCNMKYRYARVLFALEDFKTARPLLEGVFKDCPGDEVAYYYSLTLYRMGDKRTAYNVLDKYPNNSSNKDLHALIKGEIEDAGKPDKHK
jgi:tetratricopeptide (TPR) repeat protein